MEFGDDVVLTPSLNKVAILLVRIPSLVDPVAEHNPPPPDPGGYRKSVWELYELSTSFPRKGENGCRLPYILVFSVKTHKFMNLCDYTEFLYYSTTIILTCMGIIGELPCHSDAGRGVDHNTPIEL